MGKIKQLRKRIAAQRRVIAAHEKKIKAELRRPAPEHGLHQKMEAGN